MSQKGRKKYRSKFDLKGKFIFFGTNNFHKFDEARSVLAKRGMAIGMLRVKALEIQSESLGEIARASVIDAFSRCRLPMIAEDAGLFVEALKGFPGPYAAYVYKTIGNLGLLKLMKGVENRKATFQSAVAYYDGQSEPVCFLGEVTGNITKEEKSGKCKGGFGFDPIFRPSQSEKTFAEMTTEEKNCFSHRSKAVAGFAEFYEKFRTS
jgi:XTP/dITP diphosphohydrolase